MKFHGKKIEGANVEWIIIPRPDKDIIFKATAILDMKPFHDMCPAPKPPQVMKPGGQLISNNEDKNYLKAIDQYGNLRYYFTIVWSLKDTEGLEWEKIEYTNPQTWLLFEEELKEAGFSFQEIQRVIMGCMVANSLNESKIEEARARFLLSQAVQSNESSSHRAEQSTTQSGEPAKE